MKKAFLLLAFSFVSSFVTFAQEGGERRREPRPFDPNEVPTVHDPVMAYEDGKYYIFNTGMGIGMMSSTDMKQWKREKSPLSPIPAWASEVVPAYRGHTWAPDIQKVGDKWYLYYSCSSFGSNTSAIGVLTNSTLNPESPDYHWEDLGMVVRSQEKVNDYNAIDPNLVLDKKGHPWLSFGSFWDGIQLVQLENDMKTPKGKPVTISRRYDLSLRKNATNAIEAPYIIYNKGYYYLFVSFDYCCKGLNSNYKTMVGRSKKITGPYVDKDGVPMDKGGGTLLVGPNDRYSGVGHCAVREVDGKWYFLAHGYDKERNGASKLYLRQMEWNDGWPEMKNEE